MATALTPSTTVQLTPNTKASLAPNVANVVLGNRHIKPWYPSFYPEDLVRRKAEWLYVCQWCFKYCEEVVRFAEHCKVCALKEEPCGEVIYENDEVEVREVDGREHKLYTQSLSLFAKLFLETKSVFFDTSTFLYYILHLKPTNSQTPHRTTAAFFSKEHLSWDSNTLACILVFPPFQRLGLGQLLIRLSYTLAKKEGRFGGPEKPLSVLGRKGYVKYWTAEVGRWVLEQPKGRTVCVKSISEGTWIAVEDVLVALREMGMGESGARVTKSGSLMVNKMKIREWVRSSGGESGKIVVLEGSHGRPVDIGG